MNVSRIIALGFFDGVHLGHAGLLRRVRELADRTGATAAALTFDVHPDTLVFGTPMQLLSSPHDRADLMRRLYGIEEVLTIPFTREIMDTPWDVFLEKTLLTQFHASHVVCGHDFCFGRRGEGTPDRLRAYCAEHGIGCDVIPEIDLDGGAVSSTRIRALVQKGEIREANRLLGHPHCMTGIVVPGRQLGRTIGIPTANLHIPDGIVVPAFGVYASRIYLDGEVFSAVANVGCRPTVDTSGTVTVEPWILDFDRDIYGREIRIEYHAFLRGERKFASLTDLQAEIFRNEAETRAYFRSWEESV